MDLRAKARHICTRHSQQRSDFRAARVNSSSEATTSGSIDSQEPDRDALVELGVFGPTHGLGGEMRLQAITDAVEERLLEPGKRSVSVIRQCVPIAQNLPLSTR